MATLYRKPSQTKKERSGLPWLKITLNTVIFGGLLYLLASFYPVLSVQAAYYIGQWTASAQEDAPTVTTTAPASTTFGQLLQEGPILKQAPVNTSFSVIINKINVNTPVVADVNPADKDAYLNALNSGAAHALGTVKPGQVGNSYIFAHSTANIFNIERYAAVFTLLGKLDVGDRITTFYADKRYDYIIDRKYVVDFSDVSPLTATFDHPVLTLQTCDPPGTEFKRLILVSHLEGTYSK